jgi:hypothetical protein
MGWTLGILIVVGMLLLRLVVPLLVTFALGYALHRLAEERHPEATR